ncbi:MAG: hypothetical protein M3O15_14170, partial [Acidobacteriota bacterium]|nr:hypothetical protein [Acidobacteriota bacterium]
AAVGFALFQDLLFDWQRFRIHVRLLLGPMSEDYQDFPNSLSGHLGLLQAFAKQTAFALNPALTVVCLLGIGLLVYRAVDPRRRRGLRDPGDLLNLRDRDGLPQGQNQGGAGEGRRELYLLGSVVFLIVSYYVTFLNAILFIFDRYVLPVTMILALCGGFFLGEMLRPGARRLGLRWAAAILVCGYSVLYAASVDCRMLADSRYYVEDWVDKHALRPESAVGVGRRKHIPRFQWVPWERALHSQGEVLTELRPEYIAINVTDFRHDQEADFSRRLASGELGYRLIFTRQSRPLIDLLGEADGGSSQRFINPEIALFGRIGG